MAKPTKVSDLRQSSAIAAIRKSTASIARRAGTLQKDIQKTAMTIVALWQKSGPTFANEAAELITGLQKASPYHADAFSKWIGAFTGLQWAKENNVWYADGGKLVMKGKTLTEMRETPFYEFAPAKKANPFEFVDALEALINKATSDLKRQGDKSTVDKAVLHKLREVARSVEADPAVEAD